jgi:parvulin-like peptidyl-prolyl isomerase
MEQQLLTFQFWEALAAADIPLLLIAGFIGWKLRSIAHRAQPDADEVLKLAREKQQDVTEKLAVATTEGMKLQEQLGLHDKGFAELASLQSSIRSTIDAIKRVNDSSDALRTTLTTAS